MSSEQREGCFALRVPRELNVLEGPEQLSAGCKRVILQSCYPSHCPENSRLPLEMYGCGTRGTVLCIHGFGSTNLKFLKWFPRNFKQYDFTGAAMILPYHYERTPKSHRSGELFLVPDREVTGEHFEHAVVDAMTCLAYLREYAPGPLYIMGFSLGGFIATIVAALMPEIRNVSLVVAGGNFYYITWKSFVTHYLRVRYEEDQSCDAARCFYYHGVPFKDFLRDLESPMIKRGRAPISCFEYDPVTYAQFVHQPVLMFGARYDVFVPKKAVRALYETLPHAHLVWLFSGHLSSILWKRNILRKTAAFFRSEGKSL